jgi:hypothetical protein
LIFLILIYLVVKIWCTVLLWYSEDTIDGLIPKNIFWNISCIL